MGNLGFYQISVQGLVKILPGEGNNTFCCNYIRAVVSGIKGQKMAQDDKKYVCCTPYLRNRISYDCHLW